MISVDLETIINDNAFFKGLKMTEQKKVFNIIQEFQLKSFVQSVPVKIARDTIFIVCRGTVLINSINFEDKSQIIREINPGEAWFGGELDIVDTKKIIFNLSPKTIVMQLRLSDLYYQIDYRRIFFKISKNAGLNHPNELQDGSFKENELLLLNQNELERRVISTQYFVTTVLLMMCLYILFLNSLEFFVAMVGTTVPVTIGFLSLCLAVYIWFLRNSHLPASVVGLTFANTRVAVIEALIGAPALLFLAVVFKWIMIHTVPSLSHEPLFEMEGAVAKVGGWDNLFLEAAVYAFLSVPLQEMINRGGVQGCLQMMFAGRKSMWQPILVSNIVFASFHIMISPFASLVIFFPGLYWSWLFARHNNLIGVCVSHAIFGTTAFFFIGYLDILKI